MIELIKDKYYIYVDKGHYNYSLIKGNLEKIQKNPKKFTIGYYNRIEWAIEGCINEISGTRLEKHTGTLQSAIDEILKAKNEVMEVLKKSKLNKVSYKKS